MTGLYDPPKALTQVLTEPGPANRPSTPAAPASSATNTLPSPTTTPAFTTALSRPHHVETQVSSQAAPSSIQSGDTETSYSPATEHVSQPATSPALSATPEQSGSTAVLASIESGGDPAPNDAVPADTTHHFTYESSDSLADPANTGPQTLAQDLRPSLGSQDVGGIIASVLAITDSLTTNDPGNAQTAVAAQGGAVAGETMSPASRESTVGGQSVSAVSSGSIVEESQTLGPPSASNPVTTTAAVLTIGTSMLTAFKIGSGSGVVLYDENLSQGQVTTIGSHVISADVSKVIVDGTDLAAHSQVTQAAASPHGSVKAASVAVITASGVTMTVVQASESFFIISGSALAQGAEVTISDHTISAGVNGLVIDGTETAAVEPQLSDATGAILTVDGTLVYTALETTNDAFVVAGTVVLQGSHIQVSRHTFSVGASGVVVDETYTARASQLLPDIVTTATASAESGLVFTVGAHTYTADEPSSPSGVVASAGHTISVGGPAVTIDGTVVSVDATGIVVQGSKTVPWSGLSIEPSTVLAVSSSDGDLGGGLPTAAGSSGASHPSSAGGQRFGSVGGRGVLLTVIVMCVYAALGLLSL